MPLLATFARLAGSRHRGALLTLGSGTAPALGSGSSGPFFCLNLHRKSPVGGVSDVTNCALWSGRRVLVGGGCGLIGSYLVPELVAAGAEVTVVDNLENGDTGSLDSVGESIQFLQADLRERTVCERVTRGQDIVINLAARSFGMGYSSTHHGEMLTHNLLCTLTPLEAARANVPFPLPAASPSPPSAVPVSDSPTIHSSS